MYIDDVTDPLERALRRLEAVAYTLNVVRTEIYDPQDVDTRADLMIATYNVVNEAFALLHEVNDIVWPEHQSLETGQEG
jgi:hypothetical protein